MSTSSHHDRVPPENVSFVIPVRNDAGRLRRCLNSIRANIGSGAVLDVVVADNGSIDESAVIARQAGAAVMRLPGLRVSELRNRGAAAASGEVLAFVDADHEIGRDWVAAASETLRAGGPVAAVGALCEPPSNGTWVQRTYDLLRRRAPGIREVDWLGSGNMAVRREAFEAVGGFDTTLETCEDVDLCRRLRAAGYKIMQDSRLRSVHLGDPSTLKEVFYGELWRGRDNVRASLRRPVSLRELPSVAMPIADLGLLTAAGVGLLMLSGSGLTLAGLALGGILCASAARGFRMVARGPRATPRACAEALAVALTYDLARAIALLGTGRHQARKARA